jgi:predicted transposase/invertase (TIGR01784 family)
MGKDIDRKKSDGEPLGVFINPKTDFGFHKIFSNPDMLMSFLNTVLPEEKKSGDITSVSYLPVEHFGDAESEHHVIFDTHCKTNEGEDVVIEMQNARPMNFENRLIFYGTYPIREQAPKRKHRGQADEKPETWYYDLKPVYTVAIVNFPMLKNVSEDVVVDWIRLMSARTQRCFSDTVNFIIVDLTKFNKKETELKTVRDYWLYTLKRAETLKRCPKTIRNELFIDLYEDILRTNKLTQDEMKAYNNNVMKMEDMGLFTTYSRLEGIEIGEKRGIEIGRNEGIEIGEKRGVEVTNTKIVINAADRGISIDDISGLTGLSTEQICNILANRK